MQIKVKHFLSSDLRNFLNRGRQFSRRFHTFEWDTQFWYNEIGNIRDGFIVLNEWQASFQMMLCLEQKRNCYQLDILHFPAIL